VTDVPSIETILCCGQQTDSALGRLTAHIYVP